MNGTTRYHGRNLGSALDAQGRKRRWLAQQVGVHESMIGHVISGNRTASEELATRIAQILGVPLFLIFESHKRNEITPLTDEQAEQEPKAA